MTSFVRFAIALLLSEISHSMARSALYGKQKLASRTFIHDRHVFKAHVYRYSQRTVKMRAILYSK